MKCRKGLHEMAGANLRTDTNGRHRCRACVHDLYARKYRPRGEMLAVGGHFPDLPRTPGPSGAPVLARKPVRGTQPTGIELGTVKRKYGEGPRLVGSAEE